ncbi:hypothetical protein EV174_005483, partial [Coemansia sp. RSA 2320]
MGYFNRYLLLLVFNVLNAVAFGAVVSVAAVNIADHSSPTNLIIYYAYTGILSLALLVAEFRAPRLLNSQARFLFTYSGRGLIFTYFGCIVYTNTLYNVIACIYTVSLGVVYLVVAWLPCVPLQHGILYNWSRWCRVGSSQFYSADGTDTSQTRGSGGSSTTRHQQLFVADKTDRPHYFASPALVATMAHAHAEPIPLQATAHELNPNFPAYVSALSMEWPESPPDHAVSSAMAHPVAEGSPAEQRKNESFIYGVTVATKQSNTTGDAYLDSIVNSSRFAREMMMEAESDDQVIVVRNEQQPIASPVSHGLAAELGPLDNTHSLPRPCSQASLATHNIPGAPHSRISSPMPYHVFAPQSRVSLNENILHVSRALNSVEEARRNPAS